MKCPKDGSPLQPVIAGRVQLDKCHQCDGIWCDAGELERLRALDIDHIEREIEERYGNPKVVTGELEGYMRCPRCPEGRLQGVTVTYASRVRVDRCDACLGIWLDRHELDLVLAERPPAGRAPRTVPDDSAPLIDEDEDQPVASLFRRLGRIFHG